MKTKNAMQLKALINNRAKRAGVSPQLMLQCYTCERRKSVGVIERRASIIEAMRADSGLMRQWKTYASKHSYAQDITFGETLDAVADAMEAIVSRMRDIPSE